MSIKGQGISIGLRVVIIAAVCLALMIPASLITGVIREREMTRNNAIKDVSEKWGGSQTLAGPILTVPFKSYVKDKDGNVIQQIQNAHFLPDELLIDGVMQPEVRYRGLYQVMLYGSKLHMAAKFSKPSEKDIPAASNDILWDEAYIACGISDLKGIKDKLSINWNSEAIPATPGIPDNDVVASGVSAKVNVRDANSVYAFAMNLNLNGAQELNFIPVGKENLVSMASKWSAPGFQGSFLPEARTITKDGFTAQWKVLQLNRNYPQKWVGKSHSISSSSFGVNLVTPVDGYQKTMRTTKYALMFIALTFAAFFAIELHNKKMIHPVQYFLVGLSLILFYSLLLSLSEHMSFQASYLIATCGTVALIGAYCRSLFSSNVMASVIAAMISVLYGFLYIILQLEDYALLMGSTGLFGVLALFMYLTRNIDWYMPFQPKAGRTETGARG